MVRQPGRLTLHGAGGNGASLGQCPSRLAPFSCLLSFYGIGGESRVKLVVLPTQ